MYHLNQWSNASCTVVALLRFNTGVMSSSSCVAPVPALSLSTMATGATRGAVMLRLPGLADVHVAAPLAPPVPPLTIVQVAGMPLEKFSSSADPLAGAITPIVWLKLPDHDPSFAVTLTWNATEVPQARPVPSLAVKCGAFESAE